MTATYMLFVAKRMTCLMAVILPLLGCATVQPPSLSGPQVSSLRLEEVVVEFSPEGRIWWGDGERMYAESKGFPANQSEQLGKTPEGREFVRARIAEKLQSALRRSLTATLAGTRPVRLHVTVKAMHISSAVQRVVLGGMHSLTADMALVDAGSGQTLLDRKDVNVFAGAGQGMLGVLIDQASSDPIDRVSDNLATMYSGWLRQS